MLDQEKIGKLIAVLRKEKNMTQEQLAEKLGVSNRSVSRWENGKTMPDLAMLPNIGEELGVSVSELLSGERTEKEMVSDNGVRRIIELSEQESNVKAKKLNAYFATGLFCIVLVILHGQYGVLNFAKNPDLLAGVLTGLGIVLEIAGFYKNNQEKHYTEKEMQVLTSKERKIKMKTAEEMLQYAKKYQKAGLRQYAKGFQAIEKELRPEEAVCFTMVADNFFVNEEYLDGWKPWHIAAAVSDHRLMLCGEAIRGRFMTFYDVDSYELEKISAVEFVNQKIRIQFSEEKITIEGKELERVFEKLKEALKA